VILVIGARSIGQAIARRVSAGKQVVLADLRPENAEAALAENRRPRLLPAAPSSPALSRILPDRADALRENARRGSRRLRSAIGRGGWTMKKFRPFPAFDAALGAYFNVIADAGQISRERLTEDMHNVSRFVSMSSLNSPRTARPANLRKRKTRGCFRGRPLTGMGRPRGKEAKTNYLGNNASIGLIVVQNHILLRVRELQCWQ